MFSLILNCITIACALISIFFTIRTICLRNKTYEDISEIYKTMEKKAIDNYNINAEARYKVLDEYMYDYGVDSDHFKDAVKECKKKKKKMRYIDDSNCRRCTLKEKGSYKQGL